MEQTLKKPLTIAYRAVLPFQYSAGRMGSRFFNELRENKRIMAVKCSKCARAYVPPRPVCGYCYAPCEEWVEVGPEGELIGYTVVTFAFLDPLTGKERPVPYGYGYIQLDGAATRLLHFIDETDYSVLRSGLRVRPVFKEERQGNIADIECFRIVR